MFEFDKILKFKFSRHYLPLSFNNNGTVASQLHLTIESIQLPSIPHWQVWVLESLPARKYCSFPFLSFRRLYVTPFVSNGGNYLLLRWFFKKVFKKLEYKNVTHLVVVGWAHISTPFHGTTSVTKFHFKMSTVVWKFENHLENDVSNIIQFDFGI